MRLARIRFGHECIECPCGCDEPYCPECEEHYADCNCIGPAEAHDLKYKVHTVDGVNYVEIPDQIEESY